MHAGWCFARAPTSSAPVVLYVIVGITPLPPRRLAPLRGGVWATLEAFGWQATKQTSGRSSRCVRLSSAWSRVPGGRIGRRREDRIRSAPPRVTRAGGDACSGRARACTLSLTIPVALSVSSRRARATSWPTVTSLMLMIRSPARRRLVGGGGDGARRLVRKEGGGGGGAGGGYPF